MLTPADVRNMQFLRTRLGPGYDREEVDNFLERVEAGLDLVLRDNQEIRARITGIQHGARDPRDLAPPTPLFSGAGASACLMTPADVRKAQFTTTQHRHGYDQEEVDNCLGRAEAELGRLLRENEELRAWFTGSQAGAVSPQPAAPDATRLAAAGGRARSRAHQGSPKQPGQRSAPCSSPGASSRQERSCAASAPW